MRSLFCALLIFSSSGKLLVASAEDNTTRTGFAVVTLVSGNIAGLIATETIANRTDSGVAHAIVAPAPLVTTASMIVPVGPIGENTSAIAIANPSAGSGGVNLILTNALGGAVLNATIRLGPHGQFSKYLNEFFATQPTQFTSPLLLTVSSEIPIAILPVGFRNSDFASIPIVSLSTPTPVPPQPLPGPTSTATIGGPGSLVFAQVVSGGNWSSSIAIGNTSAGLQTVRIDFFGSDGFSRSSLTDIVIQPRGVFFFTTDTTDSATH